MLGTLLIYMQLPPPASAPFIVNLFPSYLPRLNCCMELSLPQTQDFAFVLVGLYEVPGSSFLQHLEIPLKVSPAHPMPQERS